MLNESYNDENIAHDIKRHHYASREQYRKYFNASSVSTDLEMQVAYILGGKKSEAQDPYDVYDITKSWAKRVEVRGMTDGVQFSASTDTGKGRSFSEKNLINKFDSNDAYIVSDFNDLIIFDKTPPLYMIPTDIVKSLYYRGVLGDKASIQNSKKGEQPCSKAFGCSKKRKTENSKIPRFEYCFKFYHLFPYELFSLELGAKKSYPSIDELIKRATISLQNQRNGV